MKINIIIFIMSGLLLGSPVFSLNLQTSEEPSFIEAGVFEDDYLFAGNDLEFAGNTLDLFFAGKKLVLDGSTQSGTYAAGQRIVINGTVGNDLVVASQYLDINGKVSGTIFSGTQEIVISSDAVINGDLFIASGNLKMNGTVNGTIHVAAGVVSINGKINGNVKAGAEEIIITENGTITGDFEYSAEHEINDVEKERISGKITYGEYHFKDFKKAEIAKVLSGISIAFSIIGLLSLLATGLLLLLFPCLKNFNYAENPKQFWHYLVWGLIPFFIYPVLIIVSMVLVVTIPLGFILLLAGLPLILLTQILGITTFGQFLFTLFKFKSTNRFLYFLFGFLFFFLISMIPIIKILGFIFFACVGWGILLEHIFKKKLVNEEVNTEQI